MAREFCKNEFRWKNTLALAFMHLMCLGVFFVGFNWTALWVGIALYWIRMFGITAGYHRYFSHRSYKTSRVFQFILAFLGGTAAQNAALWWASHHREHHLHVESERDIHSPVRHGFWWAHMGWVFAPAHKEARFERIKDFMKYPELVWLNENFFFPPLLLMLGLAGAGAFLQFNLPALEVGAWQLVIWGFFVSTVFLYHSTFLVNSAAHLWGSRRFETNDASKNNWFISLLTLGEGWHNNHHRYPTSERQGIYWWEIDITHLVLKFLSFFGVVWDLKKHPPEVYQESRKAA